jgi:hypothetical protein
MSFFPTFLIWGGIAASVPIILHLFFRSRYRVVRWAAMDFLLKAIQETSRRLKFQELILLLLRIAVLTLLALVLSLTIARIAASWGMGRGAVDAVLIMDVSGSMDAREGTRTRLDLAKEAAKEIIDSLPSASTVQILIATDKTRIAGPRQPSNMDQARDVIDRIEISSRGTDFLAALQEARAALLRAPNPNREIYLISDMQKQGLTQTSALKTVMEAVEKENTKVFAVHCGTQTPKNAAIEGILPRLGILHTGTRAEFTVLVRNTAAQPIRDLKVTLKLAGQEKGEDSRTLPTLEPGELKPVPLAVELKQPGYQILTATIEPDELGTDNRYDQVIHVHEQVRVLIVDGAPSPDQPDRAASFFLANALTPVSDSARDKHFIKTRVVTPRDAAPGLLGDRDVVILVDVPLRQRLANKGGALSADFLDELEKFVRKGKGLMIFAGPDAQAAEYNEELITRRPLLPLRLGSVVPEKVEEKPDEKSRIFFNPGSARSFLSRLGGPPLSRILSQTEVLQYIDTKDPTPEEKEQGLVEVLMTYTTGKPAVVQKRVERGKVLLFTTTADSKWNYALPLGHICVPLLQDSLSNILQSDAQTYNRHVGQPLTWTPNPRYEKSPHVLTPPVGDEVRLRLSADEGTPKFQYDHTDQAGIYRIRAEVDDPEGKLTNLEREEKRDPGIFFAVTPDLGESQNLDPGTNAEVDEGLGVKVTHLVAGQGTLTTQVTERRSQEWTILLAVVLALLLMESALAWYCGRTW